MAQVEKKISGTRHRHELGRRIANLLARGWRASAQNANRNPTLSAGELAEIVPLLCESGAGALAWWQIRNTELANTTPGHELHEVYRLFRLSALIHQREIAYVLSLLRAAGIESVLIKGWAIARLYPDAGLRPYGDIDLCIRPDQFAQACTALRCLEDINGHYVDLHCGFARIGQTRTQDGQVRRLRGFRINRDDMRVWEKLFSRSQLVPLDRNQAQAQVPTPNGWSSTADFGVTVRIPSDEDHLRLLSFHLLRGGVRRPPWLSDIGLLLESLTAAARAKDFDWAVCLGQDSDRNVNRNLNWIASTIGLAHQLLGADLVEIENSALAKRASSLPRWLVPAVLREWGRRGSSVTVLEGVASRLFDLFSRWDNPVRSTAAVGGQFNNWPRLPYRLAELLTRLPEVPQQLRSLSEHFAAQPIKLANTEPGADGIPGTALG